jgi:cholesterol oxidase
VGVNLNPPEDNSDPYFAGEGPIRKKCAECGGCMVGCRENAKNTLDRNYLWFAEKMGLEILPETKAEKITFEDGMYHVETFRITSFIKGKRKIFRARGLVVAGGTLGTLELLLKQKYKYKTLPRLSDKLGHEVRTNSESLCAVSSTREKLNNGLAITSVFEPDEHTHVEIVKYPDRSDALKWFFGLSVGGASSSLLRTLKLAGKTFSHPAAFLKTLFNFRWPTNLVIFLVMQNVDNAMKMVWKRTPTGGTIRIDNKGMKRVPAFIAVGQEVMERYAAKTGGIAQNILLEVLFDRPTTAHILGGCPMSDSGENGVVNSNMEVHGYPGMYIMDGSVIQGNIGVNPSLTITAMAEYAMSKIPDRDSQDLRDLQDYKLSKKLLLLEEEWKKKRSC